MTERTIAVMVMVMLSVAVRLWLAAVLVCAALVAQLAKQLSLGRRPARW